jgi:type IV secretory pathway TraG/TraD family ATPase VirD4
MAASQIRRGAAGDSDLVLAWAIPVVAVLLAAASAVLWLAEAVDDERASRPLPGSPFHLARTVVRDPAARPSAVGWVVAGILVAVPVVAIISLVLGIVGRVHRRRVGIDVKARHLGRGRDLQRLSRKAAEQTAHRLGSTTTGIPGLLLGFTVAGGTPLYSNFENVLLMIAGTRSGKTSAYAIPTILDAPGAVVVTSNKNDVVEVTRGVRARVGSTWVFDPQGIVGEPVSWWWDPLAAVTSLVAAEQLADHFAEDARHPEAGGDAFFDPAGRALLAQLLLAAAVDRRPITQVHTWLTDPRQTEPVAILTDAGWTAAANGLSAVLHAPERQRGGVFGTALQMVNCLTNPAVTRWVTPTRGWVQPRQFHPEVFVQSRDTLYSLSREGRGSAGPLVTALTVAVCQAAEQLAIRSPGGRLATPLLGVLDEAANVCRWKDLPSLYSHYGSRGILLATFVQSPSQGLQLWGRHGWKTLMDSANVLVYSGGVKDAEFLGELSQLIGLHDAPTATRSHGPGGSTLNHGTRPEPILSVADLQALPLGRAVILSSGARPTLVRTVPYQQGPHAAELAALTRPAVPVMLRS